MTRNERDEPDVCITTRIFPAKTPPRVIRIAWCVVIALLVALIAALLFLTLK